MFSFGDEVEETYNNPSGSMKRFLGLKGGCAANTELQSSCAKESLSVSQSFSSSDGGTRRQVVVSENRFGFEI
jgi:hypothetical protein